MNEVAAKLAATCPGRVERREPNGAIHVSLEPKRVV